ncbi:hypothetical protein BFL28_12670 [Sphingomonas turrisvirgatae]|uniref:Uncharacterized protein n=1 Tax=Sphingomonas turrisvirgatae TaxID=1888892 RepID=A0A1E3LYW2_9SPHN|nr:hypothetical protein BFL28_12670 [Sphingomonas turrisvirgatae]
MRAIACRKTVGDECGEVFGHRASTGYTAMLRVATWVGNEHGSIAVTAKGESFFAVDGKEAGDIDQQPIFATEADQLDNGTSVGSQQR